MMQHYKARWKKPPAVTVSQSHPSFWQPQLKIYSMFITSDLLATGLLHDLAFLIFSPVSIIALYARVADSMYEFLAKEIYSRRKQPSDSYPKYNQKSVEREGNSLTHRLYL